MEFDVLGSLEKLYITTVLTDCVDQLCILSHIQLSFRDSDFCADEEIKNLERNMVAEKLKNVGDTSVVRWKKAAKINRTAALVNTLIAVIWDKLTSFGNLTKLGKDHKLLELLIMATREEIEMKGTFTCMSTVITEENKRKKKFEDIMRHTYETGKKIFELSRNCAQIAKERRQNSEAHNEIVGILKISHKKLKYKASLKLSREKKLSNAHVEQEMKKIGIVYEDIVDELQSSEATAKTEENVTKTIITFLNKRHTELEEMLEYWMDRYERKIDEAQKRLDDLRNRRSLQWDRTFYILQLYTSYSQIADEYQREKQEEEKRASAEKTQVSSAVRIQTWWRFMMVRNKLGPFRVKRKGKGGKGKGKKGKK